MKNKTVDFQAAKLVESLLKRKPLSEAAWSEADVINAILGGATGTGGNLDCEKLRKGLMAIKKGQLKKIYQAVTGQPGEQIADDDVETGEELKGEECKDSPVDNDDSGNMLGDDKDDEEEKSKVE